MRSPEVLSPPPVRRSALPAGPSPGARLRAHLSGGRLDRELAQGVVPWRSAAHVARALQLTGPRSRRMMADSIQRLIDDSEARRGLRLGAVIPPSPGQVRGALAELREIETRLSSGEPLDASGLAALKRLLCDGSGPCYVGAHPGALADAMRGVLQHLEIED